MNQLPSPSATETCSAQDGDYLQDKTDNTGCIKLRVLAGVHHGAGADLPQGHWLVLGSASTCDIVLQEPSLERQHCLMGWHSGAVSLRALDGRVWAGGGWLAAGQLHVAQPYDPIWLGAGVCIAFGSDDAQAWAEAQQQLPALAAAAEQQRPDASFLGAQGAVDPDGIKATPPAAPGPETPLMGSAAIAPRVLLQRNSFAYWLTALLMTLGLGLTIFWQGALRAQHNTQKLSTLSRVVSDLGLDELVISEASAGTALLSGTVPTEAQRAELIQTLWKSGIQFRSEIVTGEHLAISVQNELRQRGFKAGTHYSGEGTVTVTGLPPSTEFKGLESQILQLVKGVTKVVFTDLQSAEAAVAQTPMSSTISDRESASAMTRVDVSAPAPDKAKRITGVVGGDTPYLVTTDGVRYFQGALMEDGTEIESIVDGTVTFNRNGKLLPVQF